MQKLLEGSLLCRVFAAVGLWFRAQWQLSRVIGRFLAPGGGEQASEHSVISRAWRAFHRGLAAGFEALRLNKLLRGSILTMPYVWCFGALVLAPVLPTMAVAAIVVASVASLLIAFGCDRGRRLSYFSANKYIFLYAFIYIVATLTSITVSGSLMGGALTTFFVLFAIVILNSVTTRRQFDALIYAFVVSGAFVSIYGIYQYLFGAVGATAWLDSEMFSDIGVRVYSTLENPNVLAMYLLLVIPFAAASIFVAKRAVPRLFFTGCLGVMLICMLLTFARGGWLGLIAAAAIFLIMLDRRFIIVGIAGLIILYFMLPDVILSRFLSIGDVGDSSTSYRMSIWLATIEMLRDYWFTGIGPGTAAFNSVYPLYGFNTVVAPHSHNLYLQIMCDAGISGIVVFLAILFTYFRALCSAVSRSTGTAPPARRQPPDSALKMENTGKDKSSKILQIAAISGVGGFLVQGFTDYSFYNYRVTLVFWAVLGVGALAACRQELAIE